jgi:hypothetical protein
MEWATTSPPPVHNFYGDPVPFDDPYGYGTDASRAYIDAIERRFGPSAPLHEDDAITRATQAGD